MIKCVLMGAGGHARVLLDALHLMKEVQVYGILDANPARIGASVDGTPIIGTDALLPQMADADVTHFVIGVGGVGNNQPRRQLYEQAVAAHLTPFTVIHPQTIIAVHAKIGTGCQILAGAIINPGAQLGEHVIVNTGAIVEHDCLIGNHVHVATGAKLAGQVTVGDNAHIGAGAVIRQGIQIGARAIVGAGAAVVKDVPDDVTVVGVPAKILKS